MGCDDYGTFNVDIEAVKRPAHFLFPDGSEVKSITQWLNFFRGNAVKYICRAGRKNPAKELEDLMKARECIDQEIERLKRWGPA